MELVIWSPGCYKTLSRNGLNSCSVLAVTFPTQLSPIMESPDIMKLKTLKGLALQDILTQVHTYVHRGTFPGSLEDIPTIGCMDSLSPQLSIPSQPTCRDSNYQAYVSAGGVGYILQSSTADYVKLCQ